jgi:hypothetical protein
MRPIAEYAAPFREGWAVHEAFRRLGFPPDSIHVHKNPSPDDNLCVVLRHIGKQFAVTVGKVTDDWEAEWTAFAQSVNSHGFTEAELYDVWDGSFVANNTVSLLLGLKAKGIEPVTEAN